MNSATIDGKKFKVPGSWEELSQLQARQILRLLLRPYSEEQKRQSLLLILFQVKKSLWLLWFFFAKATKAHFLQLYPLTDFISKVDLCINHYPFILIGRKKLYGPSSHLMNASFIEFITADNTFLRLCRTQNTAEIDKIIAILYRPSKSFFVLFLEKMGLFGYEFTTDKRKKYNDDTLAERIDLVKKLHPDVKSAILDYFYACRTYIAEHSAHSYIFCKSSEENIKKVDPAAWHIILNDMSGSVFGTFEETAHTNLYNIFLNLNLRVKRNKELEEQMNKK